MRLLTIVTLFLFLIVSLDSRAQISDRRGFAVYGGIGASIVRDDDGAQTFRGNSFGLDLGVEFRFADVFGVSVGGFSLGKPSDTLNGVDTEYEVYGSELLARVYLPASENVEGYLLFGGAIYHVVSEPFGFNGLFGDEAWVLGGGVDIYSNESYSWRLEGRYFNGRRDESAGLLTLGFNYRF